MQREELQYRAEQNMKLAQQAAKNVERSMDTGDETTAQSWNREGLHHWYRYYLIQAKLCEIDGAWKESVEWRKLAVHCRKSMRKYEHSSRHSMYMP